MAEEYEVIDMHFHLFRDLSMEKAGNNPFPGRRDRDRYGTPEPLTKYMERVGISKTAFLCWFPTREVTESALKKLPPTLSKSERAEAEEKIKQEMPDRIRRHNEWACDIGKKYPHLLPFVGIQPILSAEGMAEEITVRFKAGAKGVKLHPGIHRFFPDDKVMWPFYDRCQELGVAITADSAPFHGAPKGTEFGQPIHFAEVLKNFPRLKLILAHLGTAFWDERIELAKQYPNVCFDSSQGFCIPINAHLYENRGLAVEDAVRVIRKIGADRIVFGSDGPRFRIDPVWQIQQILALDLTEQEKRMILSDNARRLLGL